MTTTQFRQDGDRVAKMRAILELPIVQEWLGAMRESGPDNASIADEMTPQMGHIQLGKAKGYALYHNAFKLGGTHLVDTSRTAQDAALTSKLQPEEF